MKVIIDADACPKNVLSICIQECKANGVELLTIASFDHNIQSDNHITVDDRSQATDIKIMNLVSANDVVITQDWGLAAMILSKKAICLDLRGREYRDDLMDMLLAERDIKARYRRNGGKTKGPNKRTHEDDLIFKDNFLKYLITKQNLKQ